MKSVQTGMPLFILTDMPLPVTPANVKRTRTNLVSLYIEK